MDSTTAWIGSSGLLKASVVTMEVINITAWAVSIWALLSMTLCGLKNGLFRKKLGGSSLNSGLIYGSATAVVALTIPCFVLNEIHLRLSNIPSLIPYCEVLCDVASSLYAIVFCGVYVILWIHQRLIFSHPSVKMQIPIVVDRFSMLYCVLLLSSCPGIIYLYVYPNEYVWDSYTCVGVEGDELESMSALTIVFMTLIYMIPMFSVYAAMRVNFQFLNPSDPSQDGNGSAQSLSLIKVSSCWKNFIKADNRLVSPIQMAVRRNVICSFAVVIMDILSLSISEFIVHRNLGQPMIITWTMYNGVLPFKILLVLALMGPLKKVICPLSGSILCT